jgi:hypothetical protein
MVPRGGNSLILAEGLVPPAGTARAGEQAPALGRRDMGAAARQRTRDLVAQTEMSPRHPAATLPHYPLWDRNRDSGPGAPPAYFTLGLSSAFKSPSAY